LARKTSIDLKKDLRKTEGSGPFFSSVSNLSNARFTNDALASASKVSLRIIAPPPFILLAL